MLKYIRRPTVNLISADDKQTIRINHIFFIIHLPKDLTMWSTKRSAAVLLILNLSVVYSASNFNGTQSVASTSEGVKTSLNRPSSGEGCISGNDDTVNSGDLCLFSCGYGFCPEPLCTCLSNGPIKALPPQTVAQNATALDEHDMDLNHLCQFACQYGHCPDDICNPSAKSSEPQAFDYAKAREENSRQCLITKDRNGEPDVHGETCINVCQPQVDQAKAEGRITSYGCLGHFPLDKEIPWQEISPGNWAVTGTCLCDNKTVNWAGGLLIDILAGIGQVRFFLTYLNREECIVDQIRPAAISSCQP